MNDVTAISVDYATSEITGLPEDSTPGVRIADVVIGERARKDYGDLTDLMESIRQHGLLQPIGLWPGNRLLFGGRRLEACRRLGWQSIPYTAPQTIADTVSALKAERDENTCRKAMTPSELVSLGRAIEEQERPKAEERRREGNARGGRGGGEVDRTDTSDLRGAATRPKNTDEIVGAGLGISGSNYGRAKRLLEAAEAGDASAAEAVERMDKSGAITPAYNAWKGRPSAPNGNRTPADTPTTGPDKSRAAVAARVEKARELAGTGRTSAQIAAAIGMSETSAKEMFRREGIEVHADKAIGKTRRLDANRVIEQTVRAVEVSPELLAAINYGDLDRNALGEWISSLSESLKALRSLKTTLEKELSRVTE